MSTERANNGRFLGALGFLGFLGFLAFTGTGHSELTRLAWVSLLSLISLGVFIPFDKARVKIAVDPKKKVYLGSLVFLGFLSFLGSTDPEAAVMAVFAAMAGTAVNSSKTADRQLSANQSC
jgi:predicted permease